MSQLDGLGEYGLVIAVGLLASVGVTTIFSLAILGAVRSAESRRGERRAAAAAWAALSMLAVAGVGAAIGVGLIILAS